MSGATTSAAEVADRIRARLGIAEPAAAIILGSGLGGLAERLEGARSVPYAEIPGFAAPSVAGHTGVLHGGRLAGREVLAFAGRFHLYEGHPAAATGFPVRVARALGARVLLVSNAAGGIRRTFRPGDLMVINDHLNLTWHNPLAGHLVPGDERFPDMSSPYDPALRALLHDSARALGDALEDGVYAGLTGPSYETPAEVRMLERLGADAIGMSTVAEVLVARAIGVRVAGVSCITNFAAGLSWHRIEHEDVLRVTAQAASRFEAIATEFVRRVDGNGE
jgi:purine-nucleoside phosphorylase